MVLQNRCHNQLFFFSKISFQMLFSIKIQDVVYSVTSSSFGTNLFIRSNSQFFNYTAYVIFLFLFFFDTVYTL